ncbi:MAG TPA: helix-hairpin-helix domain-containing protein [Polyangiaceae bacterium]|jgi:competence ComEA-like helix-hairpin-helix protein|nr:helix-hairpin-helix domain-containing protein [Polyangiaceae bacterium]
MNQTVESHAIRLGANHGYCIQDDIAYLNAEVEIASESRSGRDWALQLWACERPYTGGDIAGFKVAEAKVAWPSPQDSAVVQGSAVAHCPPTGPDYSMVLVLAATTGSAAQVYDFANYPARERFAAPHFAGSVGYAIEGEQVSLKVGRIENPRPTQALSGALSLELWAFAEPRTEVEPEGHGVRLANAEIGVVAGQLSVEQLAYSVPFAAPPAGSWHLALLLRERTANAGILTRDACCFSVQYQGASKAAAPESAAQPATADAKASDKVSIQSASLEALAAVKGVGLKLAKEIIKSRPFQSLEDLLRVRGIGERLLIKLRPFLSL